MKKLIFEWDDAKNDVNQSKHDISFEDPDHSIEEERFLFLGFSLKLKVLVVCHCYRSDDSIIRIISARKATKKERKVYFRRAK